MKHIRRSLSIILVLSIFLTMAVGTLTVNASSTGNSDDYRTWTHSDSRWKNMPMGTTTVSNHGAPTTAITKLVIQAGLRDAHDFGIGDMAALLSYNSSNAVVWNSAVNTSLNLFSREQGLMGDGSTTSYSPSSYYSTLINYIKNGWHLVLKVNSSSVTGNFVAVDEKLTLASGSKVYIMDCYSNTSNNINVVLGKRYSEFTQVIGYKGAPSASSSIDSDYRKWELNNTNWASTTLGSASYTIGSSRVGGGDLVLASTKLAVQAGTWNEDTTGEGNAVNRAAAAIGSYASGGVVNDWDDIKTGLGFQSVNNALMGSASNTTATMSTTLAANVTEIKGYLNEGYYLAIRVNSSVGWVAVDSEKTLATGDIYIMRSTPDASKNADIKLSDYYDTINRVAGFKADGVQVKLSGNATFSARYSMDGGTTSVSFGSGAFVPDGAVVTINATPKAGYIAADNWEFTENTFTASSSSATTCTFTAVKATAAETTVTYSPNPRSYNITYVYGTHSSSFDYNTIPSSAATNSVVQMDISPDDDATYVYELKIIAEDSAGNEIPVTHNGTHYTFTMPASNVTVTFTGENIDDWRKWARDDERWRNYEITNGNTVNSDGAVVLSLAKMVVQAGLQDPTTTTEDHYDVREVVDALNASVLFDTSSSQLYFTTANRGGQNKDSAGALGFDSVTAKTQAASLSGSWDILTNTTKRDELITFLKQGYHQIIRIFKNNSGDWDVEKKLSEWFVIDEEKTLAKVGDKTSGIDLSDIYIYRATADTNKNSNYTLQDLYDEKEYHYVYRNYAYLGGTTPARKVNFTIYKDGGSSACEDTHKGEVAATYTIPGEDAQSFESGAYVPSRSTVKFKYNADAGYFAFHQWTTADTSVTSLSATETDNPKEFTVSPSEFRAANNSTTANVRCYITPEEYNIYYENGDNFSYANTNPSTANYSSEVSFTITPDSGYTVNTSSVTFKDKDDEIVTVPLTQNGNNYTFTMPAQDVYINAETTVDDFRMWGIGDSRWKTSYLRGSNSDCVVGTNIKGGTLFLSIAKLIIQSGWNSSGTPLIAYNKDDSSANGTAITTVASSVASGQGGYYALTETGAINNETTAYTGWGVFGRKMGIIDNFANNSTYYDQAGIITAQDNKDNKKYVYPQLLRTARGPYNIATYAPLLRDYLRGDHSETGTAASKTITYPHNAHYNDRSYKFHLLIYVNDTYGWVAVDESQTLNDPNGKIWVWTSHGRTTNDITGDQNIVELSTICTNNKFERAAGFKLDERYVHYGSDKVSFETYKTDGTAANSSAELKGSYTYLGEEYPLTGGYDSVFYVPHGATVTISKQYISSGYKTASSVYADGKEYSSAPWTSSVVNTVYNNGADPESMTDSGRVVSTSDDSFVFTTTTSHGAYTSRPNYQVRYYIQSLPKVHLKFLGDANGTLYGARTTLSDPAVMIDQGDSIVLAPIPDAHYGVDTITVTKTNSSFGSPETPTNIDPDETLLTFDSTLTGGGDSDTYFIVQATFKKTALWVTYNYRVYNPTASGTYEYKEGDYFTNKSYETIVDNVDVTDSSAVSAAVAANAPVLQNNYFDYNINLGSISSNSEAHTASVSMTDSVHYYTVSVNGDALTSTYHYQEELTLDAEDYDVDYDNVVWTRGAESGKTGSADVCYNKIYSFRVTSDLNLNVGENLSSRTSTDGTSAVTPGYTELSRESGVEKCHQNFYIQDFYNTTEPTVYDTNGDAIEGASDITFLGAGVLFYACDTTTNLPTKSALVGNVDRSNIYSVLTENSAAFLTEASGQGKSFKGSNLNYSYINASTDNGAKLRYSTTTDSYNYFFTASINNDRTAANQKYVYRVYSFYVCSYTLGGNTYVAPVLSGSYAQAKLYSLNENS